MPTLRAWDELLLATLSGYANMLRLSEYSLHLEELLPSVNPFKRSETTSVHELKDPNHSK